MQKDRHLLLPARLAVNSEFHYPRYFSITPTGGPKPKESFAEGFFAVAAEQNPKPQTLRHGGADAEFPRNAMEGARAQAKQYGLKIVYDKTYPPTTADYTPIVRAVAATNPDIFLACSYPPDSVGIIRATHETGFKPKLYGGGHGRPAGHGHQDAARAAAERHRGLRLLAAVGGLCLRRGPRLREEVSDQVGRRRRRPLGLLPAAVRLRPDAGRRAGGEGSRRAPTTPSWPSSRARILSRPWSATSSSTPKASGRRPR